MYLTKGVVFSREIIIVLFDIIKKGDEIIMENKVYIGIDVGSKGFISIQENGAWEHYSIEDNDLYQLSEIMRQARLKNANIACVIEDVHSIFGSSAKSTFAFGFNKGYLVGLLAANQIPYTLVQPKEWQREMWGNSDMVVTYKDVTIKGKKVSKKEVYDRTLYISNLTNDRFY